MKNNLQSKERDTPLKRQYRNHLLNQTINIRRKNYLYTGIDDFLRRYPIAILNEYGERTIRGMRIC